MTGEGGEFGSGRRKEYHEYDEDMEREVKELIEEVERERSDEGKERQEYAEDDEYEQEVRDLIDEVEEERRREKTKADEAQEQYWEEEAENCIREALQDIEREKAERKASEEVETDFEGEVREGSDKPNESDHRELDNLEKNDLDNERSMEDDLGHDLDEVRDDLHDRFVNDMGRQLEGASTKEVESHEIDSEDSASEMTESSESYQDAGDGMAYATRTESGSGGAEAAETEAEEETQEVSEPEAQETSEQQTESQESEVPANEKSVNRILRNELDERGSTTSPESRELYEYNDARTHPEVSEPVEDTQETSERKSETVPSASDIETEEIREEIEDSVESIEELESHRESQADREILEPNEPGQDVSEIARTEAEGSTVEHETYEWDMSEESEGATEETEANEVPEENESLPETLDEYVERVKELLDERIEDDDSYDYVQDPLTGEIQRVPKILAEYESDEQRQRRKRKNLFAELSQEERERFKELVREGAENDDERSAEAVERAWSQAVAKAEQERKELLQKVREVLEDPEVSQLLERMSTNNESPNSDMEHVDTDEHQEVWTQERLDELLNEHKRLKENHRFQKRYRNAVSWIILMKRLRDDLVEREPTPDVLKALSSEFIVSIPTLRKWLKGESKPMLIVQLERKLGIRPSLGGKRQPLVVETIRKNEIDAKKYLPYLKAKGPMRSKTRKLLRSILDANDGVMCLEVPSELSASLVYINEEKDRLEQELSKRKQEVRMNVLGNRLYMRKWTPDPFSWTELLDEELFYLDRKWKRQTIGILLGRLRLKNLKELSEVIRSLTEYGRDTHVPIGGLNADLQSKANYLQGQSLDFVLDVMKWSLRDIRDHVTALGQSRKGQWQVKRPLFPEGLELKVFLSRLFAIIASDGHIDRHTMKLTYYEENSERRKRVREILRLLGNVWTKEYHDMDRGDSIRLPSILGRLMHKIGIPLGDKVIQGLIVPPFILNGPFEVQTAYLQELIPEEGAITRSVYGGLKILWGRSVVLHENRSSKQYASPNQLSDEIIKFVKKYGEYEQKRQCYRVSAGELRRKAKSTDLKLAHIANQLEKVTRSSPSTLLKSEQDLCRKLGIKTGRHLCYVRYYTKSGRVSAHWEAHTSSQKDVIKWWRLAPPNDVKKRTRLDKYFSEKRNNDEAS
jgi:hypothetical protein